MFRQILWRGYLRVANEDKVAKWLRRWSEAAGTEMTLRHCERYWKDKTMFAVDFTSPLGIVISADATFRTLQICGKVLPRWHVSGPYGYENGIWTFEGSAENKAQGIELLLFSITNSEEEITDETENL